MDFKTAIGETRKYYGGQRRGDAAARCALNEIEHYFVCQKHLTIFTSHPAMILDWQRSLVEDLGNGPSRANSKLSVLRQVYKTAGVAFPAQVKPLVRSKAPKWVLTEELETQVIQWLDQEDQRALADYIVFVVNSGLRVEEALRLTDAHVHGTEIGKLSLEVPGTKTAGSYDLLPLSITAEGIVRKRMVVTDVGAFLFPFTYEVLAEMWGQVRVQFDLLDQPTATLKGLRRTFAYRHRHLPPDVLQRLMRHSNLQTTSDYLNVTGMNEELRGYLTGKQPPVAMAGAGDQRVTGSPLTPTGVAKALRAAGFTAEEVYRALNALGDG